MVLPHTKVTNNKNTILCTGIDAILQNCISVAAAASRHVFRGSDWVFTCGVTGVYFAWHSVQSTEFLQFVIAELLVLCRIRIVCYLMDYIPCIKNQ